MPVQTVVITDPCGKLVGIPLPFNVQMVVETTAVDIPPYGAGSVIQAPWSAVDGRWILYIYCQWLFYMDESSWPYNDPLDDIEFFILAAAVTHYFPINIRMHDRGDATTLVVKAIVTLPQPINIPINTNFQVGINNYTMGRINSSIYNVYYLPVVP